MGIDIVAVVEYEIDYGDRKTWQQIAEVDIDRDYLLFAIMAGVRNSYDVNPIAPRRGHPDNLASYTKEIMEGGDMAETWLTMAEVDEVIADYKAHAIRLNRGCNLMGIVIVAHIMWDVELDNHKSRLIVSFN